MTLIRRVGGERDRRTVVFLPVDDIDFADPGVVTIFSEVAIATGASIVGMQLGHQDTVTALPGVLVDLAARGLAPVTPSTLLGA